MCADKLCQIVCYPNIARVCHGTVQVQSLCGAAAVSRHVDVAHSHPVIPATGLYSTGMSCIIVNA